MKAVMITLIRFFGWQIAYEKLRRQGLLFYLKALQAVRKSLILVLFVAALLQLMMMGFVGAVVAGIWLIPQETEYKLWCLFGFFGCLFLIPLIFLTMTLSERFWYEKSGVEDHIL